MSSNTSRQEFKVMVTATLSIPVTVDASDEKDAVEKAVSQIQDTAYQYRLSDNEYDCEMEGRVLSQVTYTEEQDEERDEEPEHHVDDTIRLEGTDKESRELLNYRGVWWRIQGAGYKGIEWILITVPASRPAKLKKKQKEPYIMRMAKDPRKRPFRVVDVIRCPESFDPKKHERL